MRERVKSYLIQSRTNRDIEESFVGCWTVLPMLPPRKRLGVHQSFAINVRRTRRFLRHPVFAMIPKLSHRNIRRT